MLNLEKLSQKPSAFLRLSGINYTAFTILLCKVEAHILANKVAKPISKRGRKSKLSIGLQLLLALMYIRQYSCFITLGLQFNISESYCQKRYVYIRKILMKILELPNNELLTTDKFTKLTAIDVSEQPIERPLDKQESYYSGKKRHTIKSLLVLCLETGLILAVFCSKGTKHDFQMYKFLVVVKNV